MSMNRKHQAGLHNVGSYQVSGVPWVTGSHIEAGVTEYKFEFPSVSKQLILANTGSDGAGQVLYAYFNSRNDPGVINGKHYIPIAKGGKQTINVKCKEIYFYAPYDTTGVVIFAELTGIPSESMYDLTGSGLTTIDGT